MIQAVLFERYDQNIGRNCRLHRWRGCKTCLQAFLDEVGIPQVFSLWVVQLVEKAAGAFVREKGVSQKLSLEKLKGLYQEDDVVMGEILASEKADGLTIEESFFLYILAQNWANGDEFSWACGGVEEECVSFVEEVRKMKL